MSDAETLTEGVGPVEGGAENADTTSASQRPPHRPLWLRMLGRDFIAPLCLLVLSLIMFVPGQWSVPPLDRDEPRFTQASKQMLETGNYLDIRFQEEARYKKPIGIYWLQVAAVKLSGHGADAPLWAYRLTSLFAALCVVLLTYWMARAFASPPVAFVAGLFVAVAIILGVEGRLAKTDATLFACIMLSEGALARLWTKGQDAAKRWGLAFLFWTGLALGILDKGPVAPMVVGLTVLALMAMTRKARWFKSSAPLVGVIWMLLLVLPWLVAIGIVTDGAFFREAVGHDLLGKVSSGQESHGAPPLTHLVTMLVTFWPLPAFFLLSIPKIWSERKRPLVMFCAAWFFPSWIVFELVATKLPHYTMPLLPAVALPVAAALLDGGDKSAPRWLRWVSAVLFAVPAVGLGVASIVGPAYLGAWPSPPGAVLLIIAALLSLWAARSLVAGAPLVALPRAIAACVCIAIGFWAFTGPALKPIWVSPRLVAAVKSVAPCAKPQVATVGFNEPSFIFLQGTNTLISSPQSAADFLSKPAEGEACHVATVEKRQEPAFLEAARKLGLDVQSPATRVKGLNINGGHKLDIGIYLAKKAAE